MSGVESIFGSEERTREPRAPEPSLCIYFGAERLARIREGAERAGESVSSYVCRMVDEGERAARRKATKSSAVPV